MIDIALLKLGENMSADELDDQLTEERVDLSFFGPVCFPDFGARFLGQNGSVYGEQHQTMKMFYLSLTLQVGETLESKKPPQTSCRRQKFPSSTPATVEMVWTKT